MMSDSIVFIRSEHMLLAKQYPLSDGSWRDYDTPKYIDATTVPLYGLDALARWLALAVREPHICAVRGSLIDDDSAKHIRRLVADKPNEPDGKATFRDVAKRWLALDLDGLDLPSGVDPRDLASCARSVMPRLPDAFRKARCVIQATSGHGIKPGCRLHLWFWLDRPITTREAKRWMQLEKAPVDLGLFNPVQPIYTATPVWLDGRQDHLPARLAMLEGAPAVAVPDAADLTELPSTVTTAGYTKLTTGRLTGLLRHVIGASKGSRNSCLHWSACRFGDAVERGDIQISVALALLKKAAAYVGLAEDEAQATIMSGLITGKNELGAAAAREFYGEMVS
jgi:hypothetical protein